AVIVPLAAVVVRPVVPPTVTVPLVLRFPLVALAARLPPIVLAASLSAVAFVTLALPVAPFVCRSTAPVAASSPAVIVAFAAGVVSPVVRPTVTGALGLRFPVVAVPARLPPIVLAAGCSALEFVSLRFPVPPFVCRFSVPDAVRFAAVIVPLAAVVV